MKKMLIIAAIAVNALLSFATQYTWTGGANDGGKWTTAANWGASSGYPNASGDIAVFEASATVDVNGTQDLLVKTVRITAGDVTLAASGSARLKFTDSSSDGSVGFDVYAGATLRLTAPVYYSVNRIDFQSNSDPKGGTVYYNGTIDGDKGTLYLHVQNNNFGDGCSILRAPILGIGSMNGAYQFNITGDAQILANDGNWIQQGNGSTGTTVGYTVQDGEDTVVDAKAGMFRLNRQGTSAPQNYTLKAGTFNVGSWLTAGDAAGAGDFTQEGGVSTIGTLKPQYGNVYLKGGTMSVVTEINNEGKVGEFSMSGGTLNLGSGCTVSTPFAVSGGVVKMSAGTKINKSITLTGGAVSVPSGVVFGSGVHLVLDGGSFLVDESCTWTDLKARIDALPIEGSVRFAADHPVTITVPAGETLPSIDGDGNISVLIEAGVTITDSTTLRVGGVACAGGQSLSGKVDVTLLGGTHDYSSVRALDPRSLTIDGAAMTTLDDMVVDSVVTLCSGAFEYRAGLTFVGGAKIVLAGGALKIFARTDLAELLANGAVEGGRVSFVSGVDGEVTVDVAADFVLPASLEIGGNVTVAVGRNVQLTAASTVPPAVVIRNGGRLSLADQTACIAAPVDLTIDAGGQLLVDAVGVSRTVIVAHTYVVAGVKQGYGTYYSSATATAPFYSRTDTRNNIVVPYTWTGAGDGTSIDGTANWENATVRFETNSSLDFSRAAGPVELGSGDYKAFSIAYLPPVEGPVTLRLGNAVGSTAAFNLQGEQLHASPICRKGCVIEFNVDFVNLSDKKQVTFVGGGTFRFLKNVDQKSQSNYFTMDGAVEIGGTLTTPNDLHYCENNNSQSRFTFIEGANVTIPGVISTDHSDGWGCGNGFRQTGGSVTAENVCLTLAKRNDSIAYNEYHLGGGALTLSESLILGGPVPMWPAQSVRPGGTFEMTGGTLVTPLVTIECNSNYCRLLGGDVYLGSGGFAKTTSTRTSSVPNVTAPVVLGDVTLHATEASWSSAAELEVALQGTAGFDIASGKSIVIEGVITGAGSICKAGAGTLDIRQVPAAGVVDLLSVNNLATVLLPQGADIKVSRLTVNGTCQGKGTYDLGRGTVTVANGYTWIGASGGTWSESSNWAGGIVPTADAEAEVFIDPAALPDEGPLSILLDAGVAVRTIRKVTVDCGSVNLTGAGVLSLAQSGEICVRDGGLLTLGSPVYVTGETVKLGAGKAVFAGQLRSAADTASLVWPCGNQLKVVQGEAEICCTVAGVRLFPCSEVEADMPRLTIGEGTDCCYVHGPWAGFRKTGFGEVVVNGGLVDMASGAAIFGDGGREETGKSDKYGFCFFQFGKSTFVMNGGTFRLPKSNVATMNLRNGTGDGGECTVTVNGGELYVHNCLYFGTQDGETDRFVLNDGKVDIALFAAGGGRGKKTLILNGGELQGHKRSDGDELLCGVEERSAGRNFDPVEINGPVKLTQSAADICFAFCPQVICNAETLSADGLGTVAFEYAVSGDFAVVLNHGAKMKLDYDGVKTVRSVVFGSRLHPAGDYGENGLSPRRFPGGGVIRALTGEAAPGLMITIR